MRARHEAVKRGIALVIALFSAGAADAGCADPATCGCTVTASGLAFGTYDPLEPVPADSVGTVSVTCTSNDPAGSSFSVGLGPGGSGAIADRRMRQGGASLAYNLFTNATHSTLWGEDGIGGASVAAAFPSPSGGERRLSIYGRIPARQNVVPGGYADTIVVTVAY